MKKVSNSALLELLKTHISANLNDVVQMEYTILRNDNQILVECTHMYDWESIRPTEEQCAALCSALDAENTDIHYDISEAGCETCDYGSRYGFALRIW